MEKERVRVEEKSLPMKRYGTVPEIITNGNSSKIAVEDK